MKVLITGAAGFIGFHLSYRLLQEGHTVVGLDNLNDYYSVQLKKARLAILQEFETFTHANIHLEDPENVLKLFSNASFSHVVNLAAQAGVRYSLENPHAYTKTNIEGLLNILEGCRRYPVEHLVYASSSSVYGLNTKMPFSVNDPVDHPISLYAATKKGSEMMAHVYAHLFNIPSTGLRFFTVYGPWGRPDMALFLFTDAILKDEPINVFNYGKMRRDFTYIDDIIEGVVRVMGIPPAPQPELSAGSYGPATSCAPHTIFNIGNNKTEELTRYIEIIEENLGRKAKKNLLPLQPGDVPETYADIDALVEATGFSPSTSIEVGIKNFIEWYLSYYKISL